MVEDSAAVPHCLFGSDWFGGLTLEQDHADAARHVREFDDETAFARIIRSCDGNYLGCAYVIPSPEGEGSARVYTWIRDFVDRMDLLVNLNARFRSWLSAYWAEGLETTWTSNDQTGERVASS